MKKLFLIFVFILGLSVCASAQVGDIIGDIYSTDIVTYVDGHAIPSYSINGEMLIIAEDLSNYGFNVYYDDSVRTLFVNYVAKEPSGIKNVEKGKVGEIVGKYYESDIKVVFNGKIASSYSLNGQMAVKAEALGNMRYDGIYFKYGYSENLMKCIWNEKDRKLNLYTHLWAFHNVDKFKEEYKTQDLFNWFFDKEVKLSDASLLIGGQTGTPHGTYLHYQYITNDGKCVLSLDDVFEAHRFRDIWGHIRIENVSSEGKKIRFNGIRQDGREGTYILNPKTSVLEIVTESEPKEELKSMME